MLTSILRPTRGSARVAGYDVVRQANRVRASVGVLTEQHGLYGRMPAGDYLDFFGQIYGLAPLERQRRTHFLLENFGLEADRNRRIGEYSKGMRQKLALIRAMLHDPPVLLLDEPTSAMDPQSAKLVRDAIVQLRSKRRAVILCTHNLTEAEQLADQIAIIRRGQIIARGTPAGLKRELLGPALLELRAAAPLNGVADDLADMVDIVESGRDWLRYRTPEPERVNPLILGRLAEQHLPVVTLAEVPRSLEDVYLQVVQTET
jgi:ABC-2 type transport system ATP-binding protein